MVALEDTVGAFVPGPRLERAPIGTGRLSGLTFAVKDLFDIAGSVTTYGNPDWAITHPPAIATAPVVTTLLQAGARLMGKTKTMELAYGLSGENVWQGTPTNPRAPERFPGGSSCGSAAAVAAETDAVGPLRLSRWRRALSLHYTLPFFTFYVPHRHGPRP